MRRHERIRSHVRPTELRYLVPVERANKLPAVAVEVLLVLQPCAPHPCGRLSCRSVYEFRCKPRLGSLGAVLEHPGKRGCRKAKLEHAPDSEVLLDPPQQLLKGHPETQAHVPPVMPAEPRRAHSVPMAPDRAGTGVDLIVRAAQTRATAESTWWCLGRTIVHKLEQRRHCQAKWSNPGSESDALTNRAPPFLATRPCVGERQPDEEIRQLGQVGAALRRGVVAHLLTADHWVCHQRAGSTSSPRLAWRPCTESLCKPAIVQEWQAHRGPP